MTALSNQDINSFLTRHAKESFRGVYAIDTFQTAKVPSLPAAIVVNSYPLHVSMGHWSAIFVDKNRHGAFFDSYGLAPWGKFSTFLTNNSSQAIYNKEILQQDDVSCGYHCIFFICHMNKGKKLPEILRSYKNNHISPDEMVKGFFNERCGSVMHRR